MFVAAFFFVGFLTPEIAPSSLSVKYNSTVKRCGSFVKFLGDAMYKGS